MRNHAAVNALVHATVISSILVAGLVARLLATCALQFAETLNITEPPEGMPVLPGAR